MGSAGHFTAHKDPDIFFPGHVGRMLEHPDDGRVQGLEQMGNLLVAAVDCQGVLNEVIGPDTEKIDIVGDDIGHDHRRGDLYHGTDFDITVVRQTVFFQ